DRGELIGGNNGKGAALFASLLADVQQPPELRAWALRSLPANHSVLAPDKLKEFLASDHAELRREAVWALALSDRPGRLPLLARVAADRKSPAGVRADAVLGLSADAAGQKDLLRSLARDDNPAVRKEAERGLRALDKDREVAEADRPPASNLEAWQ